MPDAESVVVLLNRVKSAIGAVGKDGVNSAQHFNFRGVDATVNAAAPHLNAHGIVVTPEVVEHHYEQLQIGSKGTAMAHVTLLVCYHFHGPAGDSVQSTVFSEALDTGDKAGAKAMSVAYRTALLQTLNLPTQDKDPDEYSYGDYDQGSRATPGASARVQQAKARKAEKAEAEVDPDSWGPKIAACTDVDTLRDILMEAGRLGHQAHQLTVDGEPMTVRDAAIARSDAIKSLNGTGASQ